MKIATRTMLAVVMGIAMWLPVPGVYAHGGDTSIIHACVGPHGENPRITGANGSCAQGRPALHWSITGPQGLAGVNGTNGTDGVDGAPGLKGDKGDIGLLGLAGVNGTNGTEGVDGVDGAPGLKGDKGDKGDQGLPGADGPEGLPGTFVKPVIWSGGCSQHGTAPDENPYCTDVEEFNTAGEYLDVDVNGTITILTAGFYRVNFWTISAGNGIANIVMRRDNGINNSIFHHGYEQTNNSWTDNSADVIQPFNAGEKLTVAVWNPGTYAYFAFGNHSKLQVQYMGSLQ